MKSYPTIKSIMKAMDRLGHKVFLSDNPADINIVGIRADNPVSNSFDDLIVVFYKYRGQLCVTYMQATTDPGKYWLEHPMYEEGTAILKPGQYRGAYAIGKHRLKPALVQKGNLTILRDPDKDDTLDTDEGLAEYTGSDYGINIHCARYKGKSIAVDKWSAGCQVVAHWYDFQILMAIAELAKETYGNSFTYTLLEEKDFY